MPASFYIKMDGVDGESTDSDHVKWMEAESFSIGVSNAVSMGSGRGALTASRPDFSNFQFSRVMDAASPYLYEHCSLGKKIPKVEVHCCMSLDGKQTVYQKYIFENAIVSGINTSGSGDGSKPYEAVDIAYSKIEWTFTNYDHKGGKVADHTKKHDLETNLGS